MRKMNVRSQPLAFDATDPVGYRCAAVRVGELLGSARTGISIYEIPAGQSICPYHYECAEEEWLLVLDGAPTLRRVSSFRNQWCLHRQSSTCIPLGV